MNHHKSPDELKAAAREALDESRALYRDGFRHDAQDKFAEANNLLNLAAEAEESEAEDAEVGI